MLCHFPNALVLLDAWQNNSKFLRVMLTVS